jgi:tRNA pseudouridine32 synthase/23S rRNA pseudouridine746 synthase
MGSPLDAWLLYADDSLLVLNKPAGLLSVPGRGEDKQDCLSARVQSRFSDALIVHRLDMATSGLMLMARGPAVQRQLNEAFASRAVLKRYIAVVDGHLPSPLNTLDGWGDIDLPIALDWPRRPLRVIDPVLGKPSQTRWRVLAHNSAPDSTANATPEVNPHFMPTTRLELEPVTGRSHQLRVHLQAIGHAILGDALYGCARSQARSDRLLLHAHTLSLPHPLDGRALALTCPAPF